MTGDVMNDIVGDPANDGARATSRRGGGLYDGVAITLSYNSR